MHFQSCAVEESYKYPSGSLGFKAGVNMKAVFWLSIGDFKVYLEMKSFCQRISKIYGKRKF